MNRIESISLDVKNNIAINNSRAVALVDELTLKESQINTLQNTLTLLTIAMKAKASPQVLADIAAKI